MTIEFHRQSRPAFFAGLASLAATIVLSQFFLPYMQLHDLPGTDFAGAVISFFFITGLSMMLMVHRHRRFELVPVFVTAGTIIFQLSQYLLTGVSTPGKTSASILALFINLLFAFIVFGKESEEKA